MIIKKTPQKNKKQETKPEKSGKEQIPKKQEVKPLEDFSMSIDRERQERRRGDRRRGYRRIDDRNIVSRAHEEANSIKERAAQQGFEYGLSNVNEELQKLNQAIADFLEAKERSMESSASDIAFLAIKVAEKIIKMEVACDETIVLNVVSDALKEISKDEKSIVIKTNPADTEIVRANIPNLFPYGNSKTKIIVMDDKNIEHGSCMVETGNGMVDATFSTQLQVLKKAFEAGL